MTQSEFIELIKTPIGCDGGNISGRIWFFGIEGGKQEDEKSPLIDVEYNPSHREFGPKHRAEFSYQYPFDRRLLQFYSAILGKGTDLRCARDMFSAHRWFSYKGDEYKGNIFVACSPKDSESDYQNNKNSMLRELSGCGTKAEYVDLMYKHRFPTLRLWVSDHNPQIIVCFGKTRQFDFASAFSSTRVDFSHEEIAERDLYAAKINGGKTTLYVVPHITGGRYGLNSNIRLQKFAERISKSLEPR